MQQSIRDRQPAKKSATKQNNIKMIQKLQEMTARGKGRVGDNNPETGRRRRVKWRGKKSASTAEGECAGNDKNRAGGGAPAQDRSGRPAIDVMIIGNDPTINKNLFVNGTEAMHPD